jgi:hypothetical protein
MASVLRDDMARNIGWVLSNGAPCFLDLHARWSSRRPRFPVLDSTLDLLFHDAAKPAAIASSGGRARTVALLKLTNSGIAR